MSMRPDPFSIPPGSARASYSVELLYEAAPLLHARTLLASIMERCPDVQRPGPDSGPLRFFHTAHRVVFPEGTLPVQTFVAAGQLDAAALAPSVKQTWKWRKAREVVQRCKASVVITDMLADKLDPRLRLGLFQRVLDGVLDAAPCVAIHWAPSQQLVDPDVFREAMARGEYTNPLHGALNVRLFQIAGYGAAPVPGGTGDSLMDTMGLSAYGMPDLQCHFHSLEHEEVARVLYNVGYEAFQMGNRLSSGDTVPGIGNAPWRCRLETALQPPEREVMDLDPGAPFAAGNRT